MQHVEPCNPHSPISSASASLRSIFSTPSGDSGHILATGSTTWRPPESAGPCRGLGSTHLEEDTLQKNPHPWRLRSTASEARVRCRPTGGAASLRVAAAARRPGEIQLSVPRGRADWVYCRLCLPNPGLSPDAPAARIYIAHDEIRGDFRGRERLGESVSLAEQGRLFRNRWAALLTLLAPHPRFEQ